MSAAVAQAEEPAIKQINTVIVRLAALESELEADAKLWQAATEKYQETAARVKRAYMAMENAGVFPGHPAPVQPKHKPGSIPTTKKAPAKPAIKPAAKPAARPKPKAKRPQKAKNEAKSAPPADKEPGPLTDQPAADGQIPVSASPTVQAERDVKAARKDQANRKAKPEIKPEIKPDPAPVPGILAAAAMGFDETDFRDCVSFDHILNGHAIKAILRDKLRMAYVALHKEPGEESDVFLIRKIIPLAEYQQPSETVKQRGPRTPRGQRLPLVGVQITGPDKGTYVIDAAAYRVAIAK